MLHLCSVTPLEEGVFGVRDRFRVHTNGGEHVGECRLAFRRVSERELLLLFEDDKRRNGSTGRLSFAIVRKQIELFPKILRPTLFPCIITPHLHERLLGCCASPKLFVEATLRTMDWRFIIATE
jgi:hypothetical protein